MIDWSASPGKMLRFTGKCGESSLPGWSDWHGSANKKEVAETAKGDNNKEILITDFSCTVAPHSRFVMKPYHGVVLHFHVCSVSKSRERIESPAQERRSLQALRCGHLDRRGALDQVSVQPAVGPEPDEQRLLGGC